MKPKSMGCGGWFALGVAALVGLSALGSLFPPPPAPYESPTVSAPSPVMDVYQASPQPAGPCPPAMDVGPCVHWEGYLGGTKTAADWLALSPEDKAALAAVASIRLGAPAFGAEGAAASLAMAACVNRIANRAAANTSLRAIVIRCP